MELGRKDELFVLCREQLIDPPSSRQSDPCLVELLIEWRARTGDGDALALGRELVDDFGRERRHWEIARLDPVDAAPYLRELEGSWHAVLPRLLAAGPTAFDAQRDPFATYDKLAAALAATGWPRVGDALAAEYAAAIDPNRRRSLRRLCSDWLAARELQRELSGP